MSKFIKENWINLLLFIPLIVSAFFIFSPYRTTISLTINWSMLGISIGFYISYSDSEEELYSVLNLIGIQITLFFQLYNVQKMIAGLNPEQIRDFVEQLDKMNRERDRLNNKIQKIQQKKEIMKILIILYFAMSIFNTILPSIF